MSEQNRRNMPGEKVAGLLRQFKPEISHDWLASDPRPDYAPPHGEAPRSGASHHHHRGMSSAHGAVAGHYRSRGSNPPFDQGGDRLRPQSSAHASAQWPAASHSARSVDRLRISSSRFTCPECLRSLDSAAAMERHLRTHSDESGRGNMKCPHCSEEIKHRTNLHRHIRIKHDEQTSKFHCRKCPMVAASVSQLERHKEKHRRCPFCKVIMESGTGLARHTQNCRYRHASQAKVG